MADARMDCATCHKPVRTERIVLSRVVERFMGDHADSVPTDTILCCSWPCAVTAAQDCEADERGNVERDKGAPF